ncbi:MAG TPA: DUF5329 domain-containing protein [Dongiaceae bacterium]|nr:DUF5329 domain-containing protein [Dongiaceae bacterium]
MRPLRSALALFVAALVLAAPAFAHNMTEEIDHLLGFIAASPCAFIRNGVEYDGAQALAHIKDKYDYYKSDIHSAEDFIRLAATRSMASGRPYQVRCDAVTTPAAEWLNKELATFRDRP